MNSKGGSCFQPYIYIYERSHEGGGYFSRTMYLGSEKSGFLEADRELIQKLDMYDI